MTSAVVQPDIPAVSRSAFTPVRAYGLLAAGGVASLGAGAIHAAAVGAHNEHRQAMIAFTIVAVFQIGWGALALTRSGRVVAAIGVAGNLAVLSGWVIAKTIGISFIDGLEQIERVQWADGLAAALAAVAVLLGAAVLSGTALARSWSSTSRVLAGGLGTGMAVISLFGMVAAGTHVHADGLVVSTGAGAHVHGGSAAAPVHDHGAATSPAGHVHPAAVVPPKVYDPKLPIDLSGVPGVTLQEQARAENLIAITLARLPHFADYKVAEAADFHSIGDGFTGFEHFINWKYIDDDHVLDPDYPEALVYSTAGGQRTLVSVMFMLKQGSTLETVPDVGGALTQWHIHDNLCFSNDPTAPKVAGVTDFQGGCPAGLQKFTPVPMLHVWITKNECGPFAALEGVGAGQIKPGEERLCDHVHGSGA